MTYEMQVFLFVAVVLTYLTLVGLVLRRELAEAREKSAKNQKAALLPSDLEYMSARRLERERMLENLAMVVRHHFERLRPEPANTGYQLTSQGYSVTQRVACSRARAARKAWLQEQVRHHFYKRFPTQQTGHGPLDGTELSELEEQVRFHFHKLRPTLETERESAS
jgi:hypothetical protein